jgi:hypothetical protein
VIAQSVYLLRYGLCVRSLILVSGKHQFPSPPCPDRLCGPPALLSSACSGQFPRGPGREADTHLHLMPRLKMRGAIPPLPIRLHGIVLS